MDHTPDHNSGHNSGHTTPKMGGNVQSNHKSIPTPKAGSGSGARFMERKAARKGPTNYIV